MTNGHYKVPETLLAAAEASERDLLVKIRAKIAAEIDGGVPPHTLAPLTRQLRDIDKEIRALDARKEQEGGAGAQPTPDEEFDASAL
jgi:hypothetical protein